ncbi:MAG: DUF748 domain-containing protein, partial [bacterium]
FEDRSRAEPVSLRLAPLDLELTGYRSAPGSSFDLRLRTGLGESGVLSVAGAVVPDPLDVRLEVDLETLALSDLAAYLEDVARLEVGAGSLSSTLSVGIGAGAGGGEGASPVSLKGRIAIDGLQTRDRRFDRDFLGWRALRLEGLDLKPEGLALEEVALEAVGAQVLLGPEGGSNLEAIFGQEQAIQAASEREGQRDEEAEAGAPEIPVADGEETGAGQASLPVRIGRITIVDSGVRFVDQSIEPELSIALSEISGAIEGLSTAPESRARVAIEGLFDRTAPLRVAGRMNPLATDLFADLTVSALGVPLSRFSSLSSRFVGYGIERGKLDLDLDYAVEASRIEARNHLVVDDLRFGPKAPGSAALSLPLPLAVAMLRDASGRIDLRIPVAGRLDDPSFDLLSVLGRSLVQLVMKAGTTPFALLPIPGGRDPSHVVFEPGGVGLDPEQRETLRAVTDLLARKPELRVDILGRADRERDARALARARIEDEIRRRAFEALSARERTRLGGPEALLLDEATRLRILESLHAERRADPNGSPEKGGRPEQGGSDAKESGGEPEGARLEALAADLELEEGALEALARSRAEALREILRRDERVDPEAVRLRETEVVEGAMNSPAPTELSLSTR